MNNHRVWTVLMPYSRVIKNCVMGKLQLNVIYSVWLAKFLWFDFLWCDGCAFGDLFIRNSNSTVKLAKTLNHKLKIGIGAKSIWELTQADFVTILFIHIQCTLHNAHCTGHNTSAMVFVYQKVKEARATNQAITNMCEEVMQMWNITKVKKLPLFQINWQ